MRSIERLLCVVLVPAFACAGADGLIGPDGEAGPAGRTGDPGPRSEERRVGKECCR